MVVVVRAMAPVDGEGTDIFIDQRLCVGVGAAGSEGFGGFQGVAGGLFFLEFANAGVVAFAHCFGVGFLLLQLCFGEPAGGRIVGVAGGFGLAEALALLLIAVFGEGPLGLVDLVGAFVLAVGSQFVAILADGFGDLLGEGLAGVVEPALAGEVEAGGGEGDAAAIEGGGGDAGFDGAFEEALHDLRDGEHDGGGVFEEGDAVVAADAGEGGFAVEFVTVTVVIAFKCVGAALLAGGFDVAALARAVEGVLGVGGGGGLRVAVGLPAGGRCGGRGCIGHWFDLVWECSGFRVRGSAFRKAGAPAAPSDVPTRLWVSAKLGVWAPKKRVRPCQGRTRIQEDPCREQKKEKPARGGLFFFLYSISSE